MQMNQRKDRIILKDQGLAYASAKVISKMLIENNNELLKVDLSNNQLQSNFRYLVDGICNNHRLISIVMKNNQLNGNEHAEGMK